MYSKKLIPIFRIILILITSFSLNNAYAAETLKVAYGKLSLIDLGSLIQNEPIILDDSLVRVQTLSGLNEEDKKSILILQGLKEDGSTDLTVRTASGIYQFHIVLDPDKRDDLIMNPLNAKSKILKSKFPLSKNRMTLVSLPKHINEYVLAGNTNLISLKQVVTDEDPEFLKTFALTTANSYGSTDIVVASKSGVYKFEVEIGNGDHTENISLYGR
jgi:hypothetical protein